MWSSDGSGSFTIAPVAEAPRGTTIVLHLKDDGLEFLEDWKIESVVRTYSDHIAHPIMLAGGDEAPRQINTANAIWTRPKSEITADQHKEFFGHISGSYSDPAITLHYRAEGRHEYTVLLYVPGEKPFDLYDPERRGRQKLYVKRVYIADDVELLPPYLRFVRGVIDSEDMPLNLSREMLQNNPQVAAIRKAVTNKVLSELKKMRRERRGEFPARSGRSSARSSRKASTRTWNGATRSIDIARFRSTKGDWVSLKDYIAGLKENQTAIYYLTAEDAAKAKASPQLEGYKARDVEVLLLTDPVDSFWVRTALGFRRQAVQVGDAGRRRPRPDQAEGRGEARSRGRTRHRDPDRGAEAGAGRQGEGRAQLEAADRKCGLHRQRQRHGPHAGEAAVAAEGFRRFGLRARSSRSMPAMR